MPPCGADVQGGAAERETPVCVPWAQKGAAVVVTPSCRAQAPHPRLAVSMRRKGVDGGPPALRGGHASAAITGEHSLPRSATILAPVPYITRAGLAGRPRVRSTRYRRPDI